MTREELLKLVKVELGSFKLTSLKERTINEELDDVLEDFGDDADANAKLVTKVTNRLKRMEGNLHADVAEEVAEYKKNYKPTTQKPNENDPDGGKGDSKYKELYDKFTALENKLKADETKKQKEAVLGQIKKSLKGKFDDAGMECKDYFLNAALSKIEIPDEDVNVVSLVDATEKLYNSELKAAGIEIGKPHSGSGNFNGKEDEVDFGYVANIRSRNNPSADK